MTTKKERHPLDGVLAVDTMHGDQVYWIGGITGEQVDATYYAFMDKDGGVTKHRMVPARYDRIVLNNDMKLDRSSFTTRIQRLGEEL